MIYVKYLSRLISRLLIIALILFLSLPIIPPTPAKALPLDYYFTLAILPDTQYYSASNPAIFDSQTAWLVANKTSLNLQYVMHMGDIVDDYLSIPEWTAAQSAMDTLTAGSVPWSIVMGNHDRGYTLASATNFNTYFPPTDANVYPVGSQRNNYKLFSVGGMDFIILNIEDNPTDNVTAEWYDQANVIAWANGVLDTYPDRRAIIVSHIYTVIGGFTPASQWQTLWDQVAKLHGNVFLMLAGNYDPQPTSTNTYWGNAGNEVKVIQTDYQTFTNGGDGWLRLLKFYPEQKKIEVMGYSPWLNSYDTTALDAFYGTTTNFDLDYGQQNSPSWWNVSWADRKVLTFDTSTVSGNVSDFGLMVHLTNTRLDYTHVNADGSDIRFVNQGDVQALNYEWEGGSFNATSEDNVAWVKVPTMTGASTTQYIYMYWNNPAAPATANSTAVWDSSYKVVYHMADSGATIFDSTGNSNNGTSTNTTQVSGLINYAQSFGGVDSKIIPTSIVTATTAMTVEAVFKRLGASSGGTHRLISSLNGYDGGNTVSVYSDGHAITASMRIGGANKFAFDKAITNADTVFNYVGALWDGANLYAQSQGVLGAASAAVGVFGGGVTSTKIGTDDTSFANCIIDEYRVSDIARSSDYLALNKLNFNDQIIYFGGENPYATVTTQAATGVAMTAAGVTSGTLNGNVTDLGGVPTTWRWFEGGTDNVTFTTFATANVSANTTGAFTASAPNNLTPGQTYYVRAVTYNGIEGDYSAGVAVAFTMPSITTSGASAVGFGPGTHATLNGQVTSMGVASSAFVYMEWGYSVAYGNTIANHTALVAGTYSDTITGFDPNQTIHYRVNVRNGSTTVNGADSTFSVASSSPSAPSFVAFNFANGVIPVVFVAFIIFIIIMLAVGGAVSPLFGLILMAVSIMMGMAFLQGIQSLLNSMWGG